VFDLGEVWELVTSPTPEWFVRRVSSTGLAPASRYGATLSADARTGQLYLFGGSVGFAHGPILDPTLWVLSRSATAAPTVEAPLTVSYVRTVERSIPFTIVNPGAFDRSFDWRLSSSVALPGFPFTGSASAPAQGLGGFDVPVTVPDGAPLNFTVTMSIHGADDAADSASVDVTLARDKTDDVESALPGLSFEGAIPNPSRAVPRFSFHLPRSGPVRLELIDLQGRRVASWGPTVVSAGARLVSLGGTASLRPGVYLARLSYEGHRLISRVALMR